MIPLAIIGLLPLVGMFGFVFAMSFVKVPSNGSLINGNIKNMDFDELKRALDEAYEYKKKQEMLK